MNAEALTKTLGGTWHGSYGMVLCPCHNDGKEPALKISDHTGNIDDVVVHCFANCDWRDIKDMLRARGLLPEHTPGHTAAPRGRWRAPGVPKPQPVEVGVDQQQRIEFARRKWREAVPLTDSPAEVYLRERGLEPGPDGWPPSLRYHSALKHGPTGLLLPALLAAIRIWPDRNVAGRGQRPADFDATACSIIAQHYFGIEPFRLIGDVAAGVVAKIAVECGMGRRGLNGAQKTAGTSGHRPLRLGFEMHTRNLIHLTPEHKSTVWHCVKPALKPRGI